MSANLPWNKTLVIVPTYNEMANIERFLGALFACAPAVSVLVVDDNSPDGTGQAVKKLQGIHSRLHLHEREAKAGLASAYLAGFQWALQRDYDFVFQMDSDFSHDPKEAASLLAAAQGCDLVIGSRYAGGIRVINWPLKRLLLSCLAGVYIRLVTGLPVRDPTGGFKCFTRHCLQRLELGKLISKGYIFQFELNYKALRCGLNVQEVPITFYERRRGSSKMDSGIIGEAFFNVLRLRWLALVGKL